MSFRYTNRLVPRIKLRLLVDATLRQHVLPATFTGSCNGIVACTDCYGRLLSLAVDPSSRHLYEDAVSKKPMNLDGLATAIKTACFEANLALRSRKEDAYHSALTHLRADFVRDADYFERWHAETGTSLRPLPFESLRDSPLLFENDGSMAASTPGKPSSNPLVEACRATSFRGTERHMLPVALLTAIDVPTIQASQRREEMADEEQFFWRRVDLIRKAQLNTVGNNKRLYRTLSGSILTPVPPADRNSNQQQEAASAPETSGV